ncbi:MAG: DUF3857 domain-containing protein [Bacteroidetes bacterium]|nr:MAG: DUF3857 domain-containing protein [Bacteroidota bacterium]
MKQVTILILFSLSLFPFFHLSAQEEKYDAIYLSLTKEYTLNTDGTMEYRYAKEQKLQNYRSFHRLFGETFILYNPDYQILTVDQSLTVMADGKNVVTPANAFNEVLPRFASHAPAFNRLRELVITHTGLEVGATVYLDYRIRTAVDFFPAFMGSTILAENQPVKSLTMILRVPENKPLFFKLFNSEKKPSETTENGFRVYRWALNGIPAMSPEDHRPNDQSLYPTLIFSTLDGYRPIAGFFMDQEAFRYATSETMNQFVTKLETDRKEKKELLFTLQDFVVKEINLFDVPGELTGYRLRTPEELWNSNGGTVAEKAVFLTALLKQAGIQAQPVLVFDGSDFNNQIGTLTTLEDWVVRAEVAGLGEVYLSVEQANAFDMPVLEPGKVFLVLKEDGTFQPVDTEAKKNALSLKGILVIGTALTLSGELIGTISGPSNPFLALTRSENKLKQYFRGGVASAEIKEISFSRLTPAESSFTCRVDQAEIVKKDLNYLFFTLPYLNTGIESWNVQALVAKRETPLEIPFPLEEKYDFTIALPDNMKVFLPKQNIRITNQAGSYLFVVSQRGGTIHVRKELTINQYIITPERYTGFKELVTTWYLPGNSSLIFGFIDR